MLLSKPQPVDTEMQCILSAIFDHIPFRTVSEKEATYLKNTFLQMQKIFDHREILKARNSADTFSALLRFTPPTDERISPIELARILTNEICFALEDNDKYTLVDLLCVGEKTVNQTETYELLVRQKVENRRQDEL